MDDLLTLKEIEKEIGIELPLVKKFEYQTVGYQVNDQGSVIALSLNNCGITKFLDAVLFFKELKVLKLGKNHLTQIPNEIQRLTKLVELNLIENKIADLPSNLKGLVNLISIDLKSNKIAVVPSIIFELTNLEFLGLGDNQISVLPSEIKKLEKLKELYLWGNKLTNIPGEIGTLKNLQKLFLENNEISKLPPSIGELKRLQRLTLQKNKLESIPKEILNLDIEFHWSWSTDGVILEDNPIQSPPSAIIKIGKAAINNYFEQKKKQNVDYLFEAKLIIIGEAGAGKTTTMQKLLSDNYELREEVITKGIQTVPWEYSYTHINNKINQKEVTYKINIWDFGGHEIYHATHQFFLSNRSLYVLVADSRKEDTDFNYWLQVAQYLSNNSPLILVQNERQDRSRALDVIGLRSTFNNLKESIRVNYENNRGLNELRESLKYYLSRLPHMGDQLPSNWIKVRQKIESIKTKYIAFRDFYDICVEENINQLEDITVLSQYLHDLGVFLHYQDDPLLKKMIFIDTDWCLKAVYRILDSEIVIENHGNISFNDILNIWSEHEYQLIIEELIQLMVKFKLIYNVIGTEHYIVPQHLEDNKPSYIWKNNNNSILRYVYEGFMPKGIISRLVVSLHQYIAYNESNNQLVWKRGVILKRNESYAEIIETYGTFEIAIRAVGNNCRELITIIGEEMGKINSTFSNLKCKILIPCICNFCKQAKTPHFYVYNDIIRRKELGRTQVECENSFEFVNVNDILNSNLFTSDTADSTKNVTEKTTVFISYSHHNNRWFSFIQKYLKFLERFNIQIWDDTRIKPGMIWEKEIEKALDSAKVAVLLVSNDFLLSDFITNNELPKLLKSADEKGTLIISLILEECAFIDFPEISRYQPFNNPKEPFFELAEKEQKKILVDLQKYIKSIFKL